MPDASTAPSAFDGWFEYGAVGLVIVTLVGIIVWLVNRHEKERGWYEAIIDRERERADRERARAGEAHDRIIGMVEHMTAATSDQAATNRTVAAALDGMSRLVERGR